MHISEQKTALREATAQRLLRMTPDDRAAESRSLCRRLITLIPQGSTICAYVPLKTEPDIRPLLKELLSRGDALYLPCFEEKLVFRRATSLLALVPGELRIPEPPKDAELLADNTADIVLVPGRAFDAKGDRLGRGAGGYDRWIAHMRVQARVPRMIGTAYECQIVNMIPSEPHDERVDIVVTARGVVESR